MIYNMKQQSDFSPAEDSHMDLDSVLYKKVSKKLSPESKREELIQKINMIMRQMDSDDLEKLYIYTMRSVGD